MFKCENVCCGRLYINCLMLLLDWKAYGYKNKIKSSLEWNWLLKNVDIRSHVFNFVVMHVKITNHTLMGKRKSSLKGLAKKVMMKAKPNIKVPSDESPYVATKVVNSTINKVLTNESPFTTIKVVNPILQTWFPLMNHHLLPLRLLIPPQTRFLLMNHHLLPSRLLIPPWIMNATGEDKQICKEDPPC